MNGGWVLAGINLQEIGRDLLMKSSSMQAATQPRTVILKRDLLYFREKTSCKLQAASCEDSFSRSTPSWDETISIYLSIFDITELYNTCQTVWMERVAARRQGHHEG